MNLNFTNFSSQALELGFFQLQNSGSMKTAGIQTGASNPLDAHSGSQDLSVYPKALNFIGEGDVDFMCVWCLTDPAVRFGVRAHFPKQVFGVGSDPKWKVCYDSQLQSASGENDPPVDWVETGLHSSSPYGFPAITVLSIETTPSITGDGIILSTVINDPSTA